MVRNFRYIRDVLSITMNIWSEYFFRFKINYSFRSMCEPQFVIKDQDGNVALRIEGPFCTFSICGDVEFKVMSPDGSAEIGKISKQWTGLLKEAFTDADNFGISFPMDLDVRMKATLLGALFLIDFMFFEKKQNEEQDGLGMM